MWLPGRFGSLGGQRASSVGGNRCHKKGLTAFIQRAQTIKAINSWASLHHGPTLPDCFWKRNRKQTTPERKRQALTRDGKTPDTCCLRWHGYLRTGIMTEEQMGVPGGHGNLPPVQGNEMTIHGTRPCPKLTSSSAASWWWLWLLRLLRQGIFWRRWWLVTCRGNKRNATYGDHPRQCSSLARQRH